VKVDLDRDLLVIFGYGALAVLLTVAVVVASYYDTKECMRVHPLWYCL